MRLADAEHLCTLAMLTLRMPCFAQGLCTIFIVADMQTLFNIMAAPSAARLFVSARDLFLYLIDGLYVWIMHLPDTCGEDECA